MPLIDSDDFEALKREVETDYKYFRKVSCDNEVIAIALKAINEYQLKSLDSLQYASAVSVSESLDYFVGCDKKLNNSVQKSKIKVINPMDG